MHDSVSLWRPIENWAQKNLPALYRDLNGPATGDDVARLRDDVGLDVTGLQTLVDMWAVHDGQKDQEPSGVVAGLTLLPIARILEERAIWRRAAGQGFAPDFVQATADTVQHCVWHEGWIPFVTDFGGNHLAVDLAPGPRGVRGQVINFGRDERRVFQVARSLGEFFAWLGQVYEGDGLFIEDGVIQGVKDPLCRHFLDALPVYFERGWLPLRPPKTILA